MGQEGATPLFEHKKPCSLTGKHLRTSNGKIKTSGFAIKSDIPEGFPQHKLTEAIERPAQ